MKLTAAVIIFFTLGLMSKEAFAQAKPMSQQMAQTVMTIWKDSFSIGDRPARWSYDQGVVLKGIEGIWRSTGDPMYFNYIQKCMDFFVDNEGNIKGYRPDEYNIDHLNNGKVLMQLYSITGKEKYKKAVDYMRTQLDDHPRTKEGSFWHKKIYPWQVWLDGLYMGQPFYAEYAAHYKQDSVFDDVTKQFILIERHTRYKKTGLLYHGCD